MNLKEIMTLVKTMTEKIIDLERHVKELEEIKNYYYEKAQNLEEELIKIEQENDNNNEANEEK